VRTCLSREFAFLRREAAVFRGCASRGERRGRQRRAGRGNIGPTGGKISVGPYSSTTVGDDRTTIAFAGMVEREFGGFMPPPMLKSTSPAESSIRSFVISERESPIFFEII
jgi:hypothetical protein